MEPINYMGMMSKPNPLGDLLQGLQVGAAFKQMNDQRAAEEQATQMKEQFRTEFSSYMQKPSYDGLVALQVKYPGMSEALKPLAANMDKKQLQSDLGATYQALSAMQSGKPEVAMALIDKHIAAAENSGLDASKLIDMKTALETNPEGAANQIEAMAGILDPEMYKKFTESRAKAFETKKGEALFPEELAQAAIKTQKEGFETAIKQSEAEYAPEKYKGEAKEKTAAAAIKEIQAKYEPKRIGLEIQKLGTEIGLNNARINEARANAFKATREGSGSLLKPSERFEMSRKLRTEYKDQTGNFQGVKESFNKISAAQPTGAGDLSLIYNFMKMLDPTSTVMSGEYASASNTGGAAAHLINTYNRIIDGQKLTEGQRKNFRSQAKALMNASRIREKEVRKGISRIGASYGLNDDDIFYAEELKEPPKVKQSHPTKGLNVPAPLVPTGKAAKDIKDAEYIIYGGKR